MSSRSYRGIMSSRPPEVFTLRSKTMMRVRIEMLLLYMIKKGQFDAFVWYGIVNKVGTHDLASSKM